MPFRHSLPWGFTKPPAGTPVDWSDHINLGLQACWLFNEGAGKRLIDIAKVHHATFAATPPVWGVSRYGKAVVFDGTDDFIDFIPSAALNPTDVLTVAIWCTPTSGLVTRTILDRLNSGEGYGVVINASGLAQFYLNGGASIASGAAINDGLPHVIVCTYNKNAAANQSKIYVDKPFTPGVATYTTAIDYSPAPRNQIGRIATVQPYGGRISQIRILSRDWTPAEIARAMKDPYAGISTPGVPYSVEAAAAAGGFFSRYYYDSLIGRQHHV